MDIPLDLQVSRLVGGFSLSYICWPMSLGSLSLLFWLEERVYDVLKINLQQFLRTSLNLVFFNCHPIPDSRGLIGLCSFLHVWLSRKNGLPFGNASSLDYYCWWASSSIISGVFSSSYDSSIYLFLATNRGFHIHIELSLSYGWYLCRLKRPWKLPKWVFSHFLVIIIQLGLNRFRISV